MTILATNRPYVLTFHTSGHSYPLSADDTQRLLDNYPALRATRYQVTLRGDDGTRSTIRPATRGGGPAFLLD